VGTGRVLEDGHIGRLAVLKHLRGTGLGAQLVNALVESSRDRQLSSVYLGSQVQAVDFYEKLGFSVYGEPYQEADLEHVYMENIIYYLLKLSQ